jgi:hypothetical protein
VTGSEISSGIFGGPGVLPIMCAICRQLLKLALM